MSRSRRPQLHRARGFSLIEVLVSLIIFGFITLATGFALTTVLRTQAAVRNRADTLQEVRGISAVLSQDLRFAFASANDTNTLFVNGGTVQGALLTFTTLSGRIAESDQPTNQQGPNPTDIQAVPQSPLRTITYAHDPSTGVFSRIESTVPGTDAITVAGNAIGTPQTVLSRRVRSITFEFYDSQNQAVRQDWNYNNDPNMQQGQQGGAQTTDTYLPQSVHVELELVGNDGEIVNHTLVIALATPTPLPAGQTPPTTTTTGTPPPNPGNGNNGTPNGNGLPAINGLGGLP